MIDAHAAMSFCLDEHFGLILAHLSSHCMLAVRATCKKYHARFEHEGWFGKATMLECFRKSGPFQKLQQLRKHFFVRPLTSDTSEFHFALVFRKHHCFITKTFKLERGAATETIAPEIIKAIRKLRFMSSSLMDLGEYHPQFDYQDDRIYVLNLESMRFVPTLGQLVVGYRQFDWGHNSHRGHFVLQGRFPRTSTGLDSGPVCECHPHRDLEDLPITPESIRHCATMCGMLVRGELRDDTHCICDVARVMAWRDGEWSSGWGIDAKHSLPPN